jgi:hypothetical protein
MKIDLTNMLYPKLAAGHNIKVKRAYFLNEINVMKSTIYELSSTARKREVFTSNFNPILVSLNLCKLGVGNIIIPYLHQAPEEQFSTSSKLQVVFH